MRKRQHAEDRCSHWLSDSRDAAQFIPSRTMIRLGQLRLEAKPQIEEC